MRDFKETENEIGAETFEALLGPELGYLYRIAFRFTGNKPDAEDLVQELLVKLYPRREELSRVSSLRPWLVRILYRMYLNSERKLKKSPLRLVKKARREDDSDDPLDRISGDDPDPEQCTRRRVLQKQIKAALDLLNRDHRAVLILHDMEGYTLFELESLLETPLGTLKSRLHRARAKLRKILEKDESLYSV